MLASKLCSDVLWYFAEAFFLPSRAGKSVLIFKNNKFWMNNQYRDKLNWACKDKDLKSCLCRVQTTLDGHFVRVKGAHNHVPNFTPENFQASCSVEKDFDEWGIRTLKPSHSFKIESSALH